MMRQQLLGVQVGRGEFVRLLMPWFATAARDLPWRRTRDPYGIWIAEVMLQQTQVRTVVGYWERWMRELPTLKHLASTPMERVLKLWEGLGYYSRARNLRLAARVLCDRWGGELPARLEDLRELPGVGRYTAGAISSIAFGKPSPVVDGNVARVLSRYFGIQEDIRTPSARELLWSAAQLLVEEADRQRLDRPVVSRNELGLRARSAGRRGQDGQIDSHALDGLKSLGEGGLAPMRKSACVEPLEGLRLGRTAAGDFNEALMEFGALVCTAANPVCGVCPVQGSCFAFENDSTSVLPKVSPRPKTKAIRNVALLLEIDGRVLVRQRSDVGVNAEFWEFPQCEAPGRKPLTGCRVKEMFQLHGDYDIARVGAIRHSITRHRILLEVFKALGRGDEVVGDGPGFWVDARGLETLALTSAHRRIAKRLRFTPGERISIELPP